MGKIKTQKIFSIKSSKNEFYQIEKFFIKEINYNIKIFKNKKINKYVENNNIGKKFNYHFKKIFIFKIFPEKKIKNFKEINSFKINYNYKIKKIIYPYWKNNKYK